MDAPELNERRTPYMAELDATIPPDWLAEFEAAVRRPLETRFRYAFIHTYKPVLDDAPFRAFETTVEYRRWCEEHLPDWLGYFFQAEDGIRDYKVTGVQTCALPI